MRRPEGDSRRGPARGRKDRKPRRPFIGRKKKCRFCKDKTEHLDWKEYERFKKMTSDRGKIISARITGNCARHQRQLVNAIKRARMIALLPFVAD